MPPKGKQQDKPKAAKVAADKTFGLKNKKGSKVQKQVAQIAQQASQAKTPDQRKKEAEKLRREEEKKAAEQAKAEVAALFKPVYTQKVPFGVDPKSVLCQYFKKGHCEKGKKCKFSHDPDVERKQEKKNLYEDARAAEKKEDSMDTWDDKKLQEVVLSKHGNIKTTTDKVCKFFIEAVENGKYGWFWTCPNGGNTCKYVHALPPGFVLKTKEQRAAEKALMDKSPLATLTLEDFLEIERHKLISGTGTPVTEESFKKWKAQRLSKKEAEDAARRAQEATGRALFEKGGWQNDSSDEESDNDEDDSGAFDLQKLREETARLLEEREAAEALAIAQRNGTAAELAGGNA